MTKTDPERLEPLAGFNQVSLERLGTMLVSVDYALDGLIIPFDAEEQGMDGKRCFETCAIARVIDLAYEHGQRGEYAHHTLHYVTHDYDYCVFYFDDVVWNVALTEDLHTHIKEVFRTALVLNGHSFAAGVDWGL